MSLVLDSNNILHQFYANFTQTFSLDFINSIKITKIYEQEKYISVANENKKTTDLPRVSTTV